MSEYFTLNRDSGDNMGTHCPSLSFKQRMIGFLACFVFGVLLDLLAWGSLVGLMHGEPYEFAVFFTAGQLVAILGSAFLVGFKRQFKSMFHKKRWFVTVLYLGAMVMTLVSALVLVNPGLTLVFLIITVLAYLWYVITYIPCGQRFMKKVFSRCW